MHNAPSVAYPVGRCAFQRWVFAVICVISGAVLVAWAWMQPLSWVWGLAVVTWCIAVVTGLHACWRSMGTLSWTGQVWCWHGSSEGSDDALGEVRVAIDVQGALLLEWTPLSADKPFATRWLWLGAENVPKLWQDLRRAVFATAQAS